MSRDYLIAIGGGLLCALLYLSLVSGSASAIIFTYMSQLPLFLVGLSLGLVPAAIACVVAAGTIMVGANFAAAGLFTVLSAVPLLIIVRHGLLSRPDPATGTEEWYPPGMLLGWLTGYGLALFAVGAIFYSSSQGGLEGTARAYMEAMSGIGSGGATDPRIERTIEALIRYFPAVMVISWLVMVTINGVLAQTVLAQFKHNRRPSPKYNELMLPGWMTIGLAVALLASLAPGQIGLAGQNAAMIMALPFFFLGLAVIHAVSYRFGARSMLLLAVYVVLILFGWPAIVVAGLGLIEQWALLRQRFAAAGTGREIE
ncbi:MAG: DUF2232 domain-containing protein [Alphaproteobacteria bacterium]